MSRRQEGVMTQRITGWQPPPLHQHNHHLHDDDHHRHGTSKGMMTQS